MAGGQNLESYRGHRSDFRRRTKRPLCFYGVCGDGQSAPESARTGPLPPSYCEHQSGSTAYCAAPLAVTVHVKRGDESEGFSHILRRWQADLSVEQNGHTPS